MRDSKKKSQLIQDTADLMRMQKRQVYKWLWDEDLREKQRTNEEQRKINSENKKYYDDILGQIRPYLIAPNVFYLSDIFVKENTNQNQSNREQVLELKFRDLKKELLVLKRARQE